MPPILGTEFTHIKMPPVAQIEAASEEQGPLLCQHTAKRPSALMGQVVGCRGNTSLP